MALPRDQTSMSTGTPQLVSRLAARFSTAVAIVGAVACGSTPTPISPTPSLKLTAVSPSVVASSGGTVITVTGTEFSGDATLLIDGLPATGLTVSGSTSITATAPAHAAGLVAIVVVSGGRSASLPSALTYVAPSGANAPPVISPIQTTGPRPYQPSAFADIGDAINVAATVSDAETPLSQLTYTWTATAGTFTGSGATVTWTAPAALSAPTTVVLTLAVGETFTEGGVVFHQTSTGSATIYAHDSQKEILDMGEDFLDLFSLQQVPPAAVLHNFSKTCDGGRGYDGEYNDTVHNQATFKTLYYSTRRLPPVEFNFGGYCSFGTRNPLRADACSYFLAHWDSQHIDSTDPLVGQVDHVDGTDQVTAVLESDFGGGLSWKLCHSSFEGVDVTTKKKVIR